MSTGSPVERSAEPRPPLPPGLLGAARAMAIDRVTAEVVSAMEDAGIPTILLKGPSIARWLYPEGGRSYCDTDLLVRASDHARAGELLRGMGFRDRLEGFSAYERGSFLAGAVAFVRPRDVGDGRGGDVDLHWTLPGQPAQGEGLWDAFSERTATLPVGGRDVRVLDRTGVALHVVVHAVQTGFRLHTDEDLRRAIAAASRPDWAEVAALAERLGIADVLGHGLRHHPAGAEIADRLGLPHLLITDSPYRLTLLGGPRGGASLSMFRGASTWPKRARAVRWMLMPSPAKVRFVSAQPGATGRALAGAYVRWWLDLAGAALPAAAFALRRPSGPPRWHARSWRRRSGDSRRS